MLYQFGPHRFEIAPLNTHEGDRTAASDFAEKPVVGVMPPLEAVGPGSETRNFRCRLFPKKFGGEADLDALDETRLSQVPQPLVRGDGKPLGWFVISELREASSAYAADGVGQVVDLDIAFRRTTPIGAPAYDQMLQDLING